MRLHENETQFRHTYDLHQPVYQGEFKNLVFGKLPQCDEVFHSLALIKERLSRVKWIVEI